MIVREFLLGALTFKQNTPENIKNVIEKEIMHETRFCSIDKDGISFVIVDINGDINYDKRFRDLASAFSNFIDTIDIMRVFTSMSPYTTYVITGDKKAVKSK